MLPFRGFCSCLFFFFFNDTATTEIYTLSLHDALPISPKPSKALAAYCVCLMITFVITARSEEHTSELQSHVNLVCRLLLEKKKKNKILLTTDYSKNTYTISYPILYRN